jgi:flagellar biosynthetic protein FliR
MTTAGLSAYLIPVLLIAARAGGLMTFAPFFSHSAVSWRLKAALAVALTAVLAPLHFAPMPGVGMGMAAMMLGREAMFGLLTGLIFQLVFDGMELAGEIIGFQMGFSLANLIDPNSPVNTPVVSVLHDLITLLIFIQLGVFRWILRALAASFRLVPLGQFGATWVMAHGVMRLANVMWVVGVQIAAPVLLATMLTDWALNFLAKASPQFPALFVGMSVKSLLGFALLAVTVAYWPRYLSGYFGHALVATSELMTHAR